VPLFTSGGLGLGLGHVILVLVLVLGLVSSGLGLGLKNLVLFTSLSHVLKSKQTVSGASKN